MNTNGKLALTVLAGISIGAMSVMAIHAQEAKTPPAYLIAETEIADRDAFQKWAEKVPETAPFRGSFTDLGIRAARSGAIDLMATLNLEVGDLNNIRFTTSDPDEIA